MSTRNPLYFRKLLVHVTKRSHRIISAISSDPSIHRTTFKFLDKHALENVKDAYEALPSHTTLHFEYMYKNNMQHIASDDADVLPIRLILGYLKSSRKRSKSAVYAYIRKQDQLSKMFLRLAGVHLTVAMLDHLEFEAPFDLIYDTYAMTERAISGLCTMAAHYFLAAGHVPAIVTRSDYRKSFVTLCAKIQPLQHVGGAWDSGDGTATGAPNSPPCAPKEPGNVGAVESDQANRQTSSEEDASTAVECEIETTGREMAQSGCDAIIATRAIPVKLSVDTHNQIESLGKTPVSTNALGLFGPIANIYYRILRTSSHSSVRTKRSGPTMPPSPQTMRK
jgi:hypothetical protein